MFGTHDLLLFALATLVINATPGADMLLAFTQTLAHGARAGLLTAVGVAAGCVVHTLAAAFGLAALLAASGTVFTLLKWMGAAYLLWLALGLLRQALQRAGDAADLPLADRPVALPPQPPRALFLQGFLTNALNPKVALFFLALLPQFIDPAATHKTAAFLLLGGWFIVQSLLFLAVFVLLVAPLAQRRVPAWLGTTLHAAGAALFIGLAARLALTERT